jgi:hypothetical protein
LQCSGILRILRQTQTDAASHALPNFPALIANNKRTLTTGPIALVLIVDDVEVDSTLSHLSAHGFDNIIAFCAPDGALPKKSTKNLLRVGYDITTGNALADIVNALIKALPGMWFYYCYNAEYLY